jgi:hypothetical protein
MVSALLSTFSYSTHPYRSSAYASSSSSVHTSEWFSIGVPDPEQTSSQAPQPAKFRIAKGLRTSSTLKSIRRKVSSSFSKHSKPKNSEEDVPPLLPPKSFYVLRSKTPVEPNTSESSSEPDQSLSSTATATADMSYSSDAPLLPTSDLEWKEHIFTLVAESLSPRPGDTSSPHVHQHNSVGVSPVHINIFGPAKPLSVAESPRPVVASSRSPRSRSRHSFLSSPKSPQSDSPTSPVMRSSWPLPRMMQRASSFHAVYSPNRPPSIPPPSVPIPPTPREVDVVIDAELEDFLELMSSPAEMSTPKVKVSIPVRAEVPAESDTMRELHRAPLQALSPKDANKPLPPTPDQASSLLPSDSSSSIGLGLVSRVECFKPHSSPSEDPWLGIALAPDSLASRAHAALSVDLSDPSGLSIHSLETMLADLAVLSEEMRAARARAIARSIMGGGASNPSGQTDLHFTPKPKLRPIASDSALRAHAKAGGKENVNPNGKERSASGSRIPVRKSSLWGSIKQKGRETMLLSPMSSPQRSPMLLPSGAPRCRIIVTPPEEDGMLPFNWVDN